jgi:hypothetical protein
LIISRGVIYSLKADVTSPSSSTPFSATVGDGGTGAILGVDHNLLQFSSYVKGSLRLVRGYSLDTQEDPLRSLLAQAQDENHRASFGWGLHLEQSARKGIEGGLGRGIGRGFIDNRWPTQTEDIDGLIKKSTTYVEKGRLIQAVVIASEENTSIDWTIGGNIQLAQRQFENPLAPPIITNYSVQTSDDGYVLSAKCNLSYRLDVQLFDNAIPLKLLHQPRHQPMLSEHHPIDFVDIFCDGKLELKGILEPKILVAVFALRDKDRSLESDDLKPPDMNQVTERLSLFNRSTNSPTPIMNLEISDKMESLSEVRYIIARNVEQLLSTAALPHSPQPGPPKIYLINSLVGNGQLEINYEATL